MDMVPGPEVVRTLSFVDQEALVGAARVGNPTVGQGATCGAEGQSAGPQSSPRHELQQAMAALKPPTPTKPSHREPDCQLCDDSVCAATPQLLYARVQDDNTSHVGGMRGLDVDGAVAAQSLMLLERSMPCSCSCPSSSARPVVAGDVQAVRSTPRAVSTSTTSATGWPTAASTTNVTTPSITPSTRQSAL
jgi:hypothetical protein